MVLLTGLTGAAPVVAQAGDTVLISRPEIDQYPRITVYIDPSQRGGSTLEGLSADQITLIENGIKRDLTDFKELQPGIQLVIALNISDPFAIQDINGRSRFDFIKESLLNWAAQPQESSPDDLSLVTNTGLEAAHLDDREEWSAVLEDYSPLLRETESDFNVLARAVEIASDPVDQPGMKRVVLLFSAQPATDSYQAIDSLQSQALDNQVMIYSVLVSSAAFFETGGAARLSSLALETGGAFLTFSGEEPLADLGQLFQPLRSTYQLRYQSSIVTSGTHTLEVSIASSPADIVGQRQFDLDVRPPNPIFLTPPRTITRSAVEDAQPAADEEAEFQPANITLPVLVEFPDGHPRELQELIFRVDGEVAARKTSPPFQDFVWDLEEYHNSGTHYLTLEAVDIMGLSRMSVATPVEIVIELPPQTLWDIITRNAPAIAGLGFILLVGVALFVMIARGTIQPKERQKNPWFILQSRRTAEYIRRLLTRSSESEELTVPSSIQPYRLIPINDLSRELFPEPISVHQKEISLGSVPGQGRIRIQHPSIIPEHARITAREDGDYQIHDAGSAAGTWLNYQQIAGSKSHFLTDGDIIHIGEAAFRFQIIPELQPPLYTEESNS